MKKFNLLVVDDDKLIVQSINVALPEQWTLTEHNSHENVPSGHFHAAFVDMHLKGNTSHAEGLQVIKDLRSLYPHLEIVAMSGNLDRNLMESCLKNGASRYLAKPLSIDEITLTLDKIEAFFLLQNATLRGNKNSVNWIGSSPESESVRRQIASFRGESGPLLIYGESGTGKEVISRLINEQENSRPFICINVAAIPENLFESELFGHVRGAFTGADQNKMGLAEAANNGDLFLDEIEALSLPLQAKFLRFLESGEIRRVGSQTNIKINTRIIAATNRPLDEMVLSGEFREDLLWRLKGKSIDIPPLRDRPSDIKELTKHFISQDAVRLKRLEPEAVTSLKQYEWPGNVRELKRVCEQLMLQSPLPVIRALDVDRILQPGLQKASTNYQGMEVQFNDGLANLVESFEMHVIKEGLKKYKEIEKLSKTLKISRSSLYNKLKVYGIDKA